MKELKFKGKLARQNGVRYIGNGYIRQDDGKEFILNGEDKVEIVPGSLTIENNPYADMKEIENPDISREQITDLHALLVTTVIKYLADNGIKDVEEIYLNADGLQASARFKDWSCFTDSSLVLCGYEDDERKIIGESM